MYDLLNEHKINMIAYCIMNNHTHILIESNSLKDLSKYMQRLNIRYSMYYNKKYNRVGYVFEIDISLRESTIRNIYIIA